MLTLSVHGEVEVADVAELAEDLVEVLLGDVLGQPLDDNLQAPRQLQLKQRENKGGNTAHTFVLRTGDRLLLLLRLSPR